MTCGGGTIFPRGKEFEQGRNSGSKKRQAAARISTADMFILSFWGIWHFVQIPSPFGPLDTPIPLFYPQKN
jgi:hypothetical protein